jgi:hypothetical protein
LTQQTNKTKSIWVLTPVFGALVFVLLYVVATVLYPGGSQADKQAAGFSWVNNYWCTLLNDIAINGQPNAAKPVAMTGLFVLCVTLACFWYLFPIYVNPGKKLKPVIQVTGALAMMVAFFLFSSINHDLVTNLASIFGLIATLGTFVGLYKAKWFKLLVFGFVIILLVGLNNYVYYSKGLIIYLPVIQKISFAAFLFWICCINICICRKQLNSEK